jgi:hypothetical protein
VAWRRATRTVVPSESVISDFHRCIFVHVPKCGGSSIEAVLWPGLRTEAELWMGFVDEFHNKYQTGGLQHLHAAQVRAEVGERRFDAYFKFAFVRNPFDRSVSQFASMRERPDLRVFIGMDEDAFARYVDLIERKTHVQWEPQARFLDDGDGTELVDFIGRFENFEADAKLVFARLGVDEPVIPHVMRSERGDYRDYYDQHTRAAVGRLYASDLERFGYRF